MAARKKAAARGRRKAPGKKKKAVRKKCATRKKAATSKTGAKKVGRKTATRKKKPATRKKATAKKAAPTRRQKAPSRSTRPTTRSPAPKTEPVAPISGSSADEIGVVLHYYPRVGAAIISVSRGTLQTGDMLHFRGHTTDFYQPVDRMEVDHQPVEVVSAGQTVGVHVNRRVREGDLVMRVA
ncbi:MAG: hypothetical protein VCE43_07990 [Myxococcota bacterium]